jgi:Rap1a immunity proteins
MRTREFKAGLASALLLTWACLMPASAAEGGGKASQIMPGCREALANGQHNPILQGFCFGLVSGLTEEVPGICAPDGSKVSQGVRIVVQYVDSHPERMDDSFAKLAVEALKAAWPCHSGQK